MTPSTRSRSLLLILSAVVLFLASCTRTNFVDKSGARTGFRWYDPKPHLLVKRSVKTNAVLEATVEILPDLSRAQYATHRSGLGSGGFSVTTVNGVLTEFKHDQTDEGPQSLNKLSAAFKAFAAHELSSREAIDRRREVRDAGTEADTEAVDVTDFAPLLDGSDVDSFSTFDASQVVKGLRSGVNMAVVGPKSQRVRALTDPLVILAVYVKRATAALTAYQTCVGSTGSGGPESCNGARMRALASMQKVSDQIVVVRIAAWSEKDLVIQLEALDAHVEQIMRALAPPPPALPRRTNKVTKEKLGEVPILYELYAMRICDGRVVGLERLSPEHVCDLIECASSPEGYQDCSAYLLPEIPVPQPAPR